MGKGLLVEIDQVGSRVTSHVALLVVANQSDHLVADDHLKARGVVHHDVDRQLIKLDGLTLGHTKLSNLITRIPNPDPALSLGREDHRRIDDGLGSSLLRLGLGLFWR